MFMHACLRSECEEVKQDWAWLAEANAFQATFSHKLEFAEPDLRLGNSQRVACTDNLTE